MEKESSIGGDFWQNLGCWKMLQQNGSKATCKEVKHVLEIIDTPKTYATHEDKSAAGWVHVGFVLASSWLK
ncbi:hypothetical protein LR48_Vigan10g273900 [Vigna angularis]|uniref:Uncharacterized protein n=1 Tax=Phaseolus angularis TaxID=3914 RepID=A0A0L9VPL7_PHAAN|nr:hypothetical protein LR48_Vigan10g273900 [Vigna angularis]